MQAFFYRFLSFVGFYWNAVTKYQLHSPFVFELVNAILEDGRWYYAFRDVERIRWEMRKSAAESVRRAVRRAASSPRQGQMLFRLAHWAAPKTMLEVGTSLGVGAMYLASGARTTRFISLEGYPDFANVARTNLEILDLKNAEVVVGEFGETLPRALERLQRLDFVFFDGNHYPEPTLNYFNACLPFSHEKTVFVFDDAYWSAGMTEVWQQIQQQPRVTLTIDFFDLSLAFIDPDFKEKQHFKVVPAAWKPWKIM